MRIIKIKSWMIFTCLLLLGALLHLGSGPVFLRTVVMPAAEADQHWGFSAEIEAAGRNNFSRRITSFADFNVADGFTKLTAWGVWQVPQAGIYEFKWECDDYGRMRLSGFWLINQYPRLSPRNLQQASLFLPAGPQWIFLEVYNPIGSGWLKLSVKTPGHNEFVPIDFRQFRPLEQASDLLFWRNAVRNLLYLGFGLFLFGLTGLLGLLLRQVPAPEKPVAYDQGWVRLWVFPAWAFAGALIFWRYLAVDMSTASFMLGRMGLAVWEGFWPIGFADKPFMGIIEAYLAAPLYAFWKPTVLILNFFSPLFYLGTVFFLFAMISKMFNVPGRITGLIMLLFPPAMVVLNATLPDIHYVVAVFLGAWLMYLSMDLARAEAWKKIKLFGWGLLTGLLIWSQADALTVAAACGFYLFIIHGRSLLKGLPYMGVGLILGLIPLWVYALWFQWPELSYEKLQLLDRVLFFFGYGLKWLLGVDAFLPFRDGAMTFQNLLYWTLLALFIFSIIILLKDHTKKPGRHGLLPLLVMTFSLLTTFFSSSPEYAGNGKEYLFVALALPFGWAALGHRLTKFKYVAPLLAILTAVVNVTGWNAKGLLNFEASFYLTQEPKYERAARDIKRAEVARLYSHDPALAFYLAPEIWAAVPPDDGFGYARGVMEVEAALSPGFLEDTFTGGKNWLGLAYKQNGKVIHSVEQPDASVAPIALENIRLYDLTGATPQSLWLSDDNLSTGLTGEPRREKAVAESDKNQGFVLELPHSQVLSSLVLIPFHRGNLPDYLRLEAADSDGQYNLIREIDGLDRPIYVSGPHPVLRDRFARLEAYFTPRPVKYLRLTVSSFPYPWSVREIYLSGPSFGDFTAQWQKTEDLLLAAVDQFKPAFIYADPWAGAVIRTKRKLYNQKVSKAEKENLSPLDLSSYLFPHWFVPGAGKALLMNKGYAGLAQERLDLEGIKYTVHDLGNLIWFELLSAQTGPMLPQTTTIDAANKLIAIPAQPEKVQWLSIVFDQQKPIMSWPQEINVTTAQGQNLMARLAGPLAFTGVSITPAPYHEALYCLEQPVADPGELSFDWPPPGLHASRLVGKTAVEQGWQVKLFGPATHN